MSAGDRLGFAPALALRVISWRNRLRNHVPVEYALDLRAPVGAGVRGIANPLPRGKLAPETVSRLGIGHRPDYNP
jgi:hypothetical protein